ncbi:MAG: hypothetical protein MUE41_05980, partial [Gemmatimonadaceae bacterium]|nr:hypothetical protein [Gemmatimonadaceae bacterium]
MLVAGVLALSGCGDGTAPRSDVTAITVRLAGDTLVAGDSADVSADLRDGARAAVGVLPTWRSSNPATAIVRGAATVPAATVVAVAPGVVEIVASVGRTTGRALLTVLPPSAFDVAIEDVQWSQATQTPDGALPMVLDGNAAVVNVLLRTTVPGRAAGTLRLTVRDAAGTVVHRDSAAARPLTATTSFADPSAQFLVPARVLRPGLTWEVVRDPTGVRVDGNAANDRFPRAAAASLATIALPPMHVRFVPIVLTAHAGLRPDLSSASVDQLLPMLLRLVPWSGLSTSVAPPLTTTARFGESTTGGTRTFWTQILAEVDVVRTTDASFREAYWIAVVPTPEGFRTITHGGFAFVPTDFAGSGAGTRTGAVLQFPPDPSFTATTLAHEFGHLFGRRHAPCGTPEDVDPAFPVPLGRIGAAGHDVVGWATGVTFGATPRVPATGDLMGYCSPIWVGPYTYAGMLAARRAGVVTAIRETPTA